MAVVYATSPVVTNGDSYLSFPTAVSLVHEHDLDLDEFESPTVQQHYGLARSNGHTYDSYPWTVALFAVPFVVSVEAAHALRLGPSASELVRTDRMSAGQLISASIITAFVVVLVLLIAYERLTGTERRRRRVATAVALVFAFGTSAWSTASRALWQHGPSMLLLSVVILVATRIERGDESPRTAAALGVAAGAAALVRPTNIVVPALLFVWMARRRRARLLPFNAGGGVLAAAWVIVNLVTLAAPIPHYSSPGRLVFHDQFFEAVAANLVSTGRGLIVFTPLVLLAGAGMIRRHGPLDRAFAGMVVLQLLAFSASREAWWAGHSFGPRFMTDVLPLLTYLALPAIDGLATWGNVKRSVLAAGIGWSVLVHAQGAYLHASACWNVVPVNIDADPERVWSLSDPQVISGWRAFLRSPRDAVRGTC